jgi:hypothetical protein
MKNLIGRKVNLSMAMQWFVFMPVILPLCVIFGAVQGASSLVQKMINCMIADLQPRENTDLA